MSEPDPLRAELIAAIDEINARYRELEGENARAAVILATCSLEDELTKLIRHKCFPRDISKHAWDLIFDAGKPLSAFKSKVDFAYAFGLFGNKTRQIIEQIGVVRVKFAHGTNARDFHHPDVFRETAKLESNPISSFSIEAHTDALIIRQQFLWLVQTVEDRLERVKEHMPGLDRHLEPLP